MEPGFSHVPVGKDRLGSDHHDFRHRACRRFQAAVHGDDLHAQRRAARQVLQQFLTLDKRWDLTLDW
jgi:hypothetical protein